MPSTTQFRVGTSGFQYPEWKGSFYPADLSAAKMLGYYSERFGTTEINYTFRRLPNLTTVEKWAKGTPPTFRLSFKAPQRITHFAKLKDCGQILAAFAESIAPAGEKQGPILFQLPPTFDADPVLLKEFLEVVPQGLRIAFEFRHQSWLDDKIFELLRGHGAALCISEGEGVDCPKVATADFGYLRLRREDYTPKEIKQWASAIRKLSASWGEAFIYFKHEETGVGPKFAQQLIKELGS